jgi:hypothetical protein
MRALQALTLGLASALSLMLASACGGTSGASDRRAAAAALAEDASFWPDPDVKSLQLYVVLTPDPQAMQSPDAFAGVDAAVNGEGARYAAVRGKARVVPSGYKVDFSVDFADLPHPAVDPAQLAPMIKQLPADARALAEGAKLAVFVRSDARILPHGDHLRLTGLVPLSIADKWDGVIIDLIARRAWTKDQWQAELAGERLSDKQLRMVTRDDADGKKWLLTRGNPKFGLPDLEMRGIPAADLEAARGRFSKLQQRLQAQGPSQAPATPCTGPKGTYDADCRQVR